MASTFKIAIATQLLTLVDQKKISLDTLIALKPRNFVPGSGILTKYFKDDQCSLSVLTLLKLMLQESDNTATDILLELSGGPLAVTKRLQDLKITGMTVNRSTLEFTRDYFNIQLPAPEKQNYDLLMSLCAKGTPDLKKFLEDRRDNSTPNAMVNLLDTLYQGKALSAESTKLLFSIMSKRTEETGRLYYYLPGVKVVQKLGTGEQVVNDVGIIYLPEPKGAIALAIFMKYVPSDQIVKDRVTALIAKTIYDYFLFQ
jgi:beta-lactamase class A